MSTFPRILALSGSTRRDSYNTKLLRIAARGAEEAGAAVDLVDLRDYAMPLYDGDLEVESGVPEAALRLKAAMKAAQGLLIASPEYNSSISAVLKNTIDWVSRPVPGEAPLAAFQGKVAALLSASPGALGGLRGLVHVRAILGNIGVIVLPEQVAIPKADEAFRPDGGLADAKRYALVLGLGKSLADIVRRLTAAAP